MLLFCLTTKCYLSPQLFVYLPIDVPIHDPTCSFLYFYLFMTQPVHFLFRLTAKIYLSTFLLLYIHRCTCSLVYLFISSFSASHAQLLLIYWGTYMQIYPKINVHVYLHASLLSNCKDMPVTTTTCAHAHMSTLSLPYFSFWFLHSNKPLVLTCPLTCSTYSQIHPFIRLLVPFLFFTWLYMLTYLSTHLLVCVLTYPPENESTY